MALHLIDVIALLLSALAGFGLAKWANR